MQITMSPAILDELRQAVCDVNTMMVEEQRNNDVERTSQRSYTGDEQRIARYNERLKRNIAHRARLQGIYTAITGDDPWVDIAF